MFLLDKTACILLQVPKNYIFFPLYPTTHSLLSCWHLNGIGNLLLLDQLVVSGTGWLFRQVFVIIFEVSTSVVQN